MSYELQEHYSRLQCVRAKARESARNFKVHLDSFARSLARVRHKEGQTESQAESAVEPEHGCVEEARVNHRERERIGLPNVSGRYRYKIGTNAKVASCTRTGSMQGQYVQGWSVDADPERGSWGVLAEMERGGRTKLRGKESGALPQPLRQLQLIQYRQHRQSHCTYTEKAEKGTHSEHIRMNEQERNKDWDEMWTQDGAQTREVYARTSAQAERLQKSARAGVGGDGSLSLETNAEAGAPDGLIDGLDRLRWRDKGWGEEAWKGTPKSRSSGGMAQGPCEEYEGEAARSREQDCRRHRRSVSGRVSVEDPGGARAGQRYKSKCEGAHLRHAVEQKCGMRTPSVGVCIGRRV
ncbi:hypothetical protein B0H13DRAFT_1916243 [Mycena leptocephala]|nr:hypothetical protein B0H13DRAFT_1916243 [Mycena leptocephala]